MAVGRGRVRVESGWHRVRRRGGAVDGGLERSWERGWGRERYGVIVREVGMAAASVGAVV